MVSRLYERQIKREIVMPKERKRGGQREIQSLKDNMCACDCVRQRERGEAVCGCERERERDRERETAC